MTRSLPSTGKPHAQPHLGGVLLLLFMLPGRLKLRLLLAHQLLVPLLHLLSRIRVQLLVAELPLLQSGRLLRHRGGLLGL